MPISFTHLLDAAFDPKTISEVLEASPSAFTGVSASDAQKLKEALGIATIREMASDPKFHAAMALLAASGKPGYDAGPGPEWEAFFATAPLAHYVNHPAGRFRMNFGPVYYRGRLDGTARVLLVGQDPSTDEILAHRIFVGRSGQRVQGLLRKLGITRSYVLANAFLFSVFGQFDSQLQAISLEAPVLNFRNDLLDRLAKTNHLEAIIAIGAGAQHAINHWPGKSQQAVFNITHPSAPEATVISSWNQNLPGLLAQVRPDDGAQPDAGPYGSSFSEQDHADIPRADLPFGVPTWHGAQGMTTSTRDGATKIIWTAPA